MKYKDIKIGEEYILIYGRDNPRMAIVLSINDVGACKLQFRDGSTGCYHFVYLREVK